MIKRTIVINNPAYLCVEHQQLLIKQDEQIHKVPLEDLAILMVDNAAVTYSHQLLMALNQYNVVMVVCDHKHYPCSLLLALDNHSIHSKIINLQATMPKPIGKSLWKMIIKAKIKAQQRVLKSLQLETLSLQRLIAKVKSGDPENCEAQAAKIYWRLLFGSDFRRDRNLEGINTLLNYGYIILRSALARAVVATGLNPALGIFHRNQYNNFCLVDDLLEPIRPLVDLIVYEMAQQQTASIELNKDNRQRLVLLLEFQCLLKQKRLPLTVALDLYVASVKQYICQESKTINIPEL